MGFRDYGFAFTTISQGLGALFKVKNFECKEIAKIRNGALRNCSFSRLEGSGIKVEG